MVPAGEDIAENGAITMSDTQGYDDPDGDDQAQHNREGYENRQKKRADEAEARAAAAERKAAFAMAGIDPNSYFAKGYDGDLEDVNAIRAAAAKEAPGALLLPPAPQDQGQPAETSTPTAAGQAQDPQGQPAPAPIATAEEADAITSGERLAAGAPPDQISEPDPYGEAAKIYESEVAQGMGARDAAGLAFAKVVQAAQQGDERVMLDRTGRRT